MSTQHLAHPDLPEFMTWDELEQLPDELAGEIELWDGRVVWVRRGPTAHQVYTARLFTALSRFAKKSTAEQQDQCWEASLETNVFLTPENKSNFLTPDFLVHRCLADEFQQINATDVILAGEVLSPSNAPTNVEAKKARYAACGIPWYWEVSIAIGGVTRVAAYVRQSGYGELAENVAPLYPTSYVLVGEWTPATHPDGVSIDYPFLIRIPWSELEY